MKRTNYLQHLRLENSYVKYRYNELLASHTKLQNDISNLNRKLDQCYQCHANTVIVLQEKNYQLSQDLNKLVRPFDQVRSSREVDGESELTFSY